MHVLVFLRMTPSPHVAHSPFLCQVLRCSEEIVIFPTGTRCLGGRVFDHSRHPHPPNLNCGPPINMFLDAY